MATNQNDGCPERRISGPQPLSPEERRRISRRKEDLERIALDHVCSDLSIVAEAVNDIHKNLPHDLRNAVKVAVKEGITDALTSTEMWGAAIKGMKKSTELAAGPFVISGVISLLKKIFTFFLIGALIHSWGGWDALAIFWKALLHK